MKKYLAGFIFLLGLFFAFQANAAEPTSTFGYKGIGTGSSGINDVINGTEFLLEEDANVSKITIYTEQVNIPLLGYLHLRAGIYDITNSSATPTLVAQTAERCWDRNADTPCPAPASGWYDFNIPYGAGLVGGRTYLLVGWGNATNLGTGLFRMKYTADNNFISDVDSYTYQVGNFPDPLTPIKFNNNKFSIYATYTEPILKDIFDFDDSVKQDKDIWVVIGSGLSILSAVGIVKFI